MWEGEPDLNVALLEAVDIGTSHAYCRIRWKASARHHQSLRAYSAFIGRGSMSRWYCLHLSLVVLRFMARWIDRAERLAHLVGMMLRRDDAPLKRKVAVDSRVI